MDEFFGGLSDLMEPVKIRILGQEYRLKSEEDHEQVQRIADYVNGKLQEVMETTEGLSERKMAILVALDIANDYFHVLKERDELASKIRQRTEGLVHQIDTVMG